MQPALNWSLHPIPRSVQFHDSSYTLIIFNSDRLPPLYTIPFCKGNRKLKTVPLIIFALQIIMKTYDSMDTGSGSYITVTHRCNDRSSSKIPDHLHLRKDPEDQQKNPDSQRKDPCSDICLPISCPDSQAAHEQNRQPKSRVAQENSLPLYP